MRIFGLSLLAAAVAIDDEQAMLSLKAKIRDNAEEALSDMTLQDHCTAQYGADPDDVDACNACLLQTREDIKSTGSAHAGFMEHHLKKGRDLVRSPAFMSELAVCLANKELFPTALEEEAEICGSIFGVEACARAAGHCFAVHHPGACSTADVSGCKEDHGFLACMATQLDHEGCNHSPIGVGGCMACGLGCLKGKDSITMATLQADDYQTCHAACQEPPAATAGAFELCHKYYGPDALQKCGGCAMQAKATAVNAQGKLSDCIGDQCLGIPSFIVAMTTCMMVPDSLDCSALELEMVPLPYKGAEEACQAAYPDDKGQCMASGAHCLALHPCKGLQECADHDGWFNCFATQMDFDLCNMHPQGVAKCMSCGATCLDVAGCSSVKDQECVFGEAFLACHRGCAACSTGVEEWLTELSTKAAHEEAAKVAFTSGKGYCRRNKQTDNFGGSCQWAKAYKGVTKDKGEVMDDDTMAKIANSIFKSDDKLAAVSIDSEDGTLNLYLAGNTRYTDCNEAITLPGTPDSGNFRVGGLLPEQMKDPGADPTFSGTCVGVADNELEYCQRQTCFVRG